MPQGLGFEVLPSYTKLYDDLIQRNGFKLRLQIGESQTYISGPDLPLNSLFVLGAAYMTSASGCLPGNSNTTCTRPLQT